MKKRLMALLLAAAMVFALSACGGGGSENEQPRHPLPQMNLPQDGDTVVLIETSEGSISAVLYEDLAPKACQNFIALADSGYYDGLLVHKAIADFVMQTGDPTLTGTGGEAAGGAGIAPEYVERLHNFTGALGMASGEDGLGHSQFYIVAGGAVSEEYVAAMQQAGYSADVIEAYGQLGGQPSLDYNYTVFGHVYEGLDIVKEIAAAKTDDYNRPKKDIQVYSITVSVYQTGE